MRWWVVEMMGDGDGEDGQLMEVTPLSYPVVSAV